MAQITVINPLPCFPPLEEGMDKAGMLEFTYDELIELYWRVKGLSFDSLAMSADGIRTSAGSSISFDYSSTGNIPATTQLANDEKGLVCSSNGYSGYSSLYDPNADPNAGYIEVQTSFPFGRLLEQYPSNKNNVGPAGYYDKNSDKYYIVPDLEVFFSNSANSYNNGLDGFSNVVSPQGGDTGNGFDSWNVPNPDSDVGQFVTVQAFCSPYSDGTNWPMPQYCTYQGFQYTYDYNLSCNTPGYYGDSAYANNLVLGQQDFSDGNQFIGVDQTGVCYNYAQDVYYENTYSSLGNWVKLHETICTNDYYFRYWYLDTSDPDDNNWGYKVKNYAHSGDVLCWNDAAAIGKVGTFSYTTLGGVTKTCNIYAIATEAFSTFHNEYGFPSRYQLGIPTVSCNASFTAVSAWDYNP